MDQKMSQPSSGRSYVWLVWPLIGVGAVLLALNMQQTTTTSLSTASPMPSNAAPAFRLQSISGQTVSLSDFRGKVVILDFWATWCPPCRREIPDFINLQSRYQSKGLQIVGIALDEPDKVKSFAQQNGMNYPVLLGTDNIAAVYGGIEGIPTTFVLDRNGNISGKFEGFKTKEDFEAEINKLL